MCVHAERPCVRRVALPARRLIDQVLLLAVHRSPRLLDLFYVSEKAMHSLYAIARELQVLGGAVHN